MCHTSLLQRHPVSVSQETRGVTQRPGQLSGDRRAEVKGTGREWSALGWRVLGLPRPDTLLDSRKALALGMSKHWDKWPSWGKLGSVPGYTEVFSLGKMPTSQGKACPGFAPTFSTLAFTWVGNRAPSLPCPGVSHWVGGGRL